MKTLRRLLCGLGIGTSIVAHAHLLAPALLELDALPSVGGAARYAVLWRTSTLIRGAPALHPRLPADCVAEGVTTSREETAALVSRWVVRCTDGPLAGRRVGVDGLRGSGVNVILRIQPARGGHAVETLLGAGHETYAVPPPEQRPAVFPLYLRLGIAHLLTGADHLLFLLGLLLLVRRTPAPHRGFMKTLAFTATAFTFGHSVTLSLASLQWIHVQQPLAELGIALTILALACALARRPGPMRPGVAPGSPWRAWAPHIFGSGAGSALAGHSLPRTVPFSHRPIAILRPWHMAFGFGLLHGLGFAGALAGIGLPQDEIPLALLAFNLGIECGQLLLLAAASLALALCAQWPRARSSGLLPVVRALPVYLMGSLAVLWCLQRAALLLG